VNVRPLIPYCYIIASVLFILGLKMLSKPTTARRGNMVSSIGMLLAIVATLLGKGMSFQWILVGAVVGSLIGAFAARLVAMTAMPEMVGLFNGFGGLASMLVGWAEFHKWAGLGQAPERPVFGAVAIFLTVLIGGVTFSGSCVAYGKLSEKITGKPILFTGQKFLNGLILALLLVAGVVYCINPAGQYALFIGVIVGAMILGVLAVIPIGGADMPVVIALLNSYSGLAACAAGFVIFNNVLIVAGSLVGASGLILTNIMCKAMNRSLANVMFAGVGATTRKAEGY
jgi:NAD(P) transhydrogenase subunit beta